MDCCGVIFAAWLAAITSVAPERGDTLPVEIFAEQTFIICVIDLTRIDIADAQSAVAFVYQNTFELTEHELKRWPELAKGFREAGGRTLGFIVHPVITDSGPMPVLMPLVSYAPGSKDGLVRWLAEQKWKAKQVPSPPFGAPVGLPPHELERFRESLIEYDGWLLLRPGMVEFAPSERRALQYTEALASLGDAAVRLVVIPGAVPEPPHPDADLPRLNVPKYKEQTKFFGYSHLLGVLFLASRPCDLVSDFGCSAAYMAPDADWVTLAIELTPQPVIRGHVRMADAGAAAQRVAANAADDTRRAFTFPRVLLTASLHSNRTELLSLTAPVQAYPAWAGGVPANIRPPSSAFLEGLRHGSLNESWIETPRRVYRLTAFTGTSRDAQGKSQFYSRLSIVELNEAPDMPVPLYATPWDFVVNHDERIQRLAFEVESIRYDPNTDEWLVEASKRSGGQRVLIRREYRVVWVNESFDGPTDRFTLTPALRFQQQAAEPK